MGVQVHERFLLQRLLQLLNQAVGLIREQQVRHVLHADVLRAHLLELHGEVYEVILGVHGRDGVAHGHLADAVVPVGGVNGLLEVSGIVQRVENADDVDAVFDGQADELVHHVVGIVLVAQNVLAAEQHLQLRLGHGLAQLAQAHPRVFIQEAQAAVKRRAAPAFQRIKTGVIQYFAGGQHVLSAHTGCGLGLMGVAKNGISNHYLSHDNFLLINESISRTGR